MQVLNFIKRLLTRPRVLYRTANALGWVTALRLVYIRLRGTADRRYALRIPQFSYPVSIRGGDSSDAIALYEILVTQEYALTAQLDPQPFIIDGGANIGIASLYFLNLYPKSRVIAVEPDQSNFELCSANLAPYGDRATLIQGALWKGEGYLALELGQKEWLTRVRDDQPGTIKAFTIPSLIDRGNGSVDLLKLDIEGSEFEIFGPEAQTWLPSIRNIAIELHGEDRKDRFLAALKEYDYDLSMNLTWTDFTEASNCYLAICQNIRPTPQDRLSPANSS